MNLENQCDDGMQQEYPPYPRPTFPTFPFGNQNNPQRLNSQNTNIKQHFQTLQENPLQPTQADTIQTKKFNPKEIFRETIEENRNRQQINEQNSQQIKQLKERNEVLEKRLKESRKESIDQLYELKQKLNQSQQEVQDKEFLYQKSMNQLEIKNVTLENYKKQIDELNNELNKTGRFNANSEIKSEIISQYQRIDKLYSQQGSVENQNNLELQQKIAEYEHLLKTRKFTQLDLDNMQDQIDKEHQNFLQEIDKNVDLIKSNKQLRNDIYRRDQEKDNIYQQLQNNKKVCSDLGTKLNYSQFHLQKQQDETNFYKEQYNKLKTLFKQEPNLKSQTSQHLMNQMDEENRQFQENQKQKAKEIEKQEEIEKENRVKEEQQQEALKKKQDQEIKEKKKQQFQHNLSKSKITHGQLDVCFLLDVTGSMDPYKEQTEKCVQKSLQLIKELTGRDVNWASICYQDKDELKKMGKYYQFDFSKDSSHLQDWFNRIKCDGGDDKAEDINGAIVQMLKLNWTSKFKIAILICDSPCHGNKYNGGCFDRYPRDDIRPAIQELISKGILFMGLNFTQDTLKMYDEFKKIFLESKKEDLFMYTDLKHLGKNLASADSEIAKWLGQASQQSTQVTNKSSRVTHNQLPSKEPRLKDGAMEALCKQGNFENFEKQPNIKTINSQFKVHKIEIKEEAFEQHLLNIDQIIVPIDYKIQEEGVWNCIRTEKPFAQGMVKDVFLMKKISFENELYVIKTPIDKGPYESMDQAITECRSHLISQRLMKKFQHDIEVACNKKRLSLKYPKVIYSDFLILEESPTQYWIAERYFKGEFVKYNNNYGFIEENAAELNKIAQAFTFYTYLISNFTYMVTDIQGVLTYFTDPAINTVKGNFESTDMGQDGISMYLVNYETKKHYLSSEILTLLDMYNEDES